MVVGFNQNVAQYKPGADASLLKIMFKELYFAGNFSELTIEKALARYEISDAFDPKWATIVPVIKDDAVIVKTAKRC